MGASDWNTSVPISTSTSQEERGRSSACVEDRISGSCAIKASVRLRSQTRTGSTSRPKMACTQNCSLLAAKYWRRNVRSNASAFVSPGRSALGGRRSRHAFHNRSEEHTSELQSRLHLVCRLLLEKKKKTLQR